MNEASRIIRKIKNLSWSQKNGAEFSLKFFALSKERLFVIKKGSGSNKDFEDCKRLKENANLDMEVIYEIEQEF